MMKPLSKYFSSIEGMPWFGLVLLWLAGAGTRLTILATPPVISQIHAEMALTETQVGVISSIPPILFAVAAILGALLISKTGALKTLVAGLLITGIGSGLRGSVDTAMTMYLATSVTGLGVALMQPALPSIVANWYPKHIVFATAIYVNGMLLGGEVIPVAITDTLLVPWLGTWREAYQFWAVVSWLIAGLIYFGVSQKNAVTQQLGSRTKWWPDFRQKNVWKLGLMMGCVNATYFATNFFIPRFLDEIGAASQTSSALIALNLGQIPASILLLMASGSLAKSRMPYLLSSAGLLGALTMVVLYKAEVIVPAAAILGFFSAIVLILMLGLPSAVSQANEVHRVSSLMLTVGYACAVITPVVSGFLWDQTGHPESAFYPMMLCSVMLFLCATKPIINSPATYSMAVKLN
jgi:MFS transporter, CP family, cyanate transporter